MESLISVNSTVAHSIQEGKALIARNKSHDEIHFW